MAKPEKKDKKADKTKSSPSKVQKVPQVHTKTPMSSTEILAKAAVQEKAVAKPAKKKEPKKGPKEEKPVPVPIYNGKSKTLSKDKISSEESTESSSEDEKPKAAQVKSVPVKLGPTSDTSESDSSDYEDKQEKTKSTPSVKPKSTPKYGVAKTTPVNLEQLKVPEPESDSSEESDSDGPANGSKPTAAQIKTSRSSSDGSSPSDGEVDSSEESSDSDEEPKAKVSTIKGSPTKKAPLSPEKDAKPNAESSSSEESSDESEAETVKPAKTLAKVAQQDSSSSSDEESDENSEDEDGDAKMADARIPAPANQKRKAAEDVPVPSKKVKLANDHAGFAKEQTSGESKTIFVGRLPWAVDSDRLAQEFASFGEVVSANVQVDRNSGRSRGFGYVTFATTEAAEEALSMNGKEIDGRTINVDRSTQLDKSQVKEKRAKAFGDTVSPPSATLFVGNLSFNTTEDAVWAFFDQYSVKSVRLPTDRETGRLKGFGYVEFEDIEGAKKAFEESKDAEIDGRSIRIDFSQPRDGPSGGGRFDRGGRGQGRGRGRGSDRGWRGRGGGRGAPRGGNPRSGGFGAYEGKKITF